MIIWSTKPSRMETFQSNWNVCLLCAYRDMSSTKCFLRKKKAFPLSTNWNRKKEIWEQLTKTRHLSRFLTCKLMYCFVSFDCTISFWPVHWIARSGYSIRWRHCDLSGRFISNEFGIWICHLIHTRYETRAVFFMPSIVSNNFLSSSDTSGNVNALIITWMLLWQPETGYIRNPKDSIAKTPLS